MTKTTGESVTDWQEIADVFASFYSYLYGCRNHEDQPHTPTHTAENTSKDAIPLFTPEELDRAISQLRNGRCRDTTGLIAEMLKTGGPTLHNHLLRLYNDVLKPDAPPPQD